MEKEGWQRIRPSKMSRIRSGNKIKRSFFLFFHTPDVLNNIPETEYVMSALQSLSGREEDEEEEDVYESEGPYEEPQTLRESYAAQYSRVRRPT